MTSEPEGDEKSTMHAPALGPGRRLRWIVAGVTLLVLALVVVVGRHRKGTAVPVLDRHPVTLVPGLHYLGGLDPAAAYVVETSEGLALIDAGLDPEARFLKGEMASLGLDWKRLRAIFLTHVHGDHCGGAQHLRAATGARVYAGQGDAAVLRAGRPREAFFSTFAIRAATPGPTTVDDELTDGQVIEMGDVRFRALATPGHTPGSICYLMERGGERALFSGDVIWALSANGHPRSKVDRPLGTYAAYLAPRYRGDADAFLSALRRLRALPAPNLLLPGHPHHDREPQSPVLPAGKWEALLDAGISEMEQLQEHYARDGAPFLDGVPKQLVSDLYYLGDLDGVALYGFFASSKLFLVDAPAGAASGGLLDDRLRQLGLTPAAPAAVLLTSGNPKETAGLAGLVERYRCPVVASPVAWEAVRKACPPGTDFLPAEELARQGWFAVEVVPLGGRGVGPVAYRLSRADASVLFAGRIPIKPNREGLEGLMADFRQGRGNAGQYRASLDRLAGLKPDLLLPALPSDGQNARLYGPEWEDLLAENRELLP
jgi:glyoxylase-like metal-dependent hydrolase (beta-lactamase superfamily II)